MNPPMRLALLLTSLSLVGCFVDEPPVEDDDAADEEAVEDDDSSSSAGESDSSGGGADCAAEFDACEPSCDMDSPSCTGAWDQCRAELYACDPSVQQEYDQCIDDQLHAKSACWTEMGCGTDQGCRTGCEIQARNDYPCEEPTPGA
jgi:hypothetical protein